MTENKDTKKTEQDNKPKRKRKRIIVVAKPVFSSRSDNQDSNKENNKDT